MKRTYQHGYVDGQWHAVEKIMDRVNSFHGPLRRTDMYRLLMDYRPEPKQ